MATKKPDVISDEGELTALSLPEANPKEPEKSYVPEGFESVEDYLKDVRETYSLDLEADDDNRTAALEDKKFVAGEQWDPRVLQARDGLPCLTINTIPQFIGQLVGDWRTNKIAVKVLPAETGDKNIADVRSDLIRSIETASRADRVFNSAFESMTICGDGNFRVAVQYAAEDVFDQEIMLQPIDDALSVVWDRLSIDPTGRDATHCFVDDVLPLKEFTRRWKDHDPSTLSTRETKPLESEGWLDTKTVKVTEHWRMIERKKLLVMFEDGSIHAFDEDTDVNKLDQFVETHGPVTRTRLAPCLYAQMHLVTGFAILAGPYEWKLNRLPIIRMAGRTVSVGERKVRYGLVRFMKDAARLRNFWRSVAAEQLGYAPKAQWIATESAVEGREEALRKAHMTRDPLLVVNDEAIIGTNIQRIEPPPMQMALLNEAQVNTQDMKDVTGIHDASLGIKSNETSGRAIMARQREGDIASLTFYDNGNAAVLEAGDVINQLIPQIYDGTRIIRIIGEDESTKLVKINDPNDPSSPDLSVGKYDVAITTGASYTTRRVEAAEAMMEAIQVYPELMQIAGDLVVKAQDWPGSQELAERLIKTIPPQLLSDKEKAEVGNQPDMQALMQQQAQVGEQLQQAMQELQKLQQENQTLKLKADIEAKKLEIDEYKAETDRLSAYAQVLKAGDEMEIKRLEVEAHQELEAHEQEHEQKMGVAQLLQNQAQFDRTKQQEAEQAEANRQQSAASEQTNSTPSSE
jgi:hypothetical protein